MVSSLAADRARETEDHHTVATVLGYAAQLAHAERVPTVVPWLVSIRATVRADSGAERVAAECVMAPREA